MLKFLMEFLKKRDNQLQYEFLPAALEISETPPSPIGRTVVWLIVAILATAILWACLGKVDEVAVARGKVVPDGRLKVVQPLEEGAITAIHVTEGQRVKKGQLLIELDSTMKNADVENLEKSISTEILERDLLKKALEGGNIKELVANSNLPDEIKDNLLKLIQSKGSGDQEKKQSLESVIEQSEADLRIGQSELQKLENSVTMESEKEQKLRALMESGGVEAATLEKLEKTIEILKEDEAKYKKLYEGGTVSKNEWLDKYNQLTLDQKEYIAQKARAAQEKSTLELNWKNANDELEMTKKELQSQQIKVEQAKSRLEEAKANRGSSLKDIDVSTLNLIVDEDKKISELQGELTKAKKSVQFQSLVAPVDGTVHGLASNTIGGVVTPAQAILTIVPDGTPLIIEASLLNKDVGFVNDGQEAAVKIDTFPFQKYGAIKGKVQSISPDAFEDEKQGSVYKMKVTLEKETVNVNGKQVHISPGMTVSTEIKTGERRIIEFFLEPIIKYADESLKLR
ncbi:MAG TPA: HlyD family type I secretion periplasmic adaptor subunit [Clostridia bacterium]